jgi:NAD(P)-dependent dehydrogenase (short-subunit alcohol dehydrogenase family)
MAFMICKTLEACSLLPKENCMKILLIGASGTIGRAVHALLAPRHDIVTVGRSSGDLRADFTQPETLQKMFEAAGQVDAIVSTAGNLHFGPLSEMTLTSGVAATEPIRHGANASTVNAALNGFVTGAAVELQRGLRINAVSPTLLTESAEAYGSVFPGFETVPAARVALAYQRSVEGAQTGKVFEVI